MIGFNSGKYDLHMVKEYFVTKISYTKEEECNEDVYTKKNENDYMFLTINDYMFST